MKWNLGRFSERNTMVIIIIKKTTHRLLSLRELTFEQEEIFGRLLYQEADFYWWKSNMHINTLEYFTFLHYTLSFNISCNILRYINILQLNQLLPGFQMQTFIIYRGNQNMFYTKLRRTEFRSIYIYKLAILLYK